jgi:hypothetical protein
MKQFINVLKIFGKGVGTVIAMQLIGKGMDLLLNVLPLPEAGALAVGLIAGVLTLGLVVDKLGKL